jgi:hypothetical protein
MQKVVPAVRPLTSSWVNRLGTTATPLHELAGGEGEGLGDGDGVSLGMGVGDGVSLGAGLGDEVGTTMGDGLGDGDGVPLGSGVGDDEAGLGDVLGEGEWVCRGLGVERTGLEHHFLDLQAELLGATRGPRCGRVVFADETSVLVTTEPSGVAARLASSTNTAMEASAAIRGRKEGDDEAAKFLTRACL